MTTKDLRDKIEHGEWDAIDTDGQPLVLVPAILVSSILSASAAAYRRGREDALRGVLLAAGAGGRTP